MTILCRIIKISSAIAVFLFLLSCGTGKNAGRQQENNYSYSGDSLPWFTGIMVYEPTSKKVIFEHNAQKYFTPASNVKLFSFYTGLKILDDSIPALKYSGINDTLYFASTGDPTFLHRDFNSYKILDFLNSRPEVLALVSLHTYEKPFGPGWAWDDYNYGFSAERSPFPIYGNVVNFHYSTNDSVVVDPPYFKDKVLFDSTGISLKVERMPLKNSFRIPIFDTSAFKQNVPFITSPKLAAELLSDTLRKQVHLINKLPEQVNLQQKLFSHPVDSLYKRMLKESDNLFAEQLLIMAAGKISDTLETKIAIDHMKKEFLKDLPNEIRWIDGSGLSRYNLFTPYSMVWVLEKIYEEIPHERLFKLLPAGGVSGTLEHDYKAPPGKEPFVYAKTGSMSNNYSLSGYLITASGKILIFSFMNSNFLQPIEIVKAEVDQVLRELYFNY